MSVRVMAAVWDHSPHRGGTLLVQLAIADHANDEGVAWPSVDSLGRKARMSSRNVQLALARLQNSGALAIERQQGAHGCNLYRLSSPSRGEKTSPPKTFQGEKTDLGGEVSDRGGEKNGMQGVKPASPEPSLTVNKNHQGTINPSGGAREALPTTPNNQVNDEFIDELVAEFAFRVGGDEHVRLALRKAQIAAGYLKARPVDRPQYLRNWLEDDALKRLASASNGRSRVDRPAVSDSSDIAQAFAQTKPRREQPVGRPA